MTTHNDLFYPEVDYLWDDDKWLDIWIEWKLYRKQMKIKSWRYVPIGEKRTLSELYRNSRGNVEEAIKLVEHAMAKGWKGLYLPDNWYKPGFNGIAMNFPREWDKQFASKLTGQELVNYYQFLREECKLKAVRDRVGGTTKWVPKDQII